MTSKQRYLSSLKEELPLSGSSAGSNVSTLVSLCLPDFEMQGSISSH